MTDAAKYITDEAAMKVLLTWRGLGSGYRENLERFRASIKSLEEQIVTAVVAEAAEGRGPAAAAALRWAEKELRHSAWSNDALRIMAEEAENQP